MGDYRIPTQEVLNQEFSSREDVKFVYDYVINVFKAHGLSIIAALSSDIPAIAFSPQDAEESSDVRAARKAEALGKVIARRNKAKLIFYHALYILYTSHFVAAYNFYDRDKKYGTIEIPKFKKEMTKVSPDLHVCEACGFSTEANLSKCPDCGSELKFEAGEEELIEVPDVPEILGKGVEHLHIKGILNVKIPTWAADQAACGYLLEYSDQHYAYLRHLYPEIPREKLKSGSANNEDRMIRMVATGKIYSDSYMDSLLTLKRLWVRPWMYEVLDDDKASELKDEFPDGAYCAFVEEQFADARKEKLDDHWTITKGDLSRSVYGDPLGKALVPLQDLENNTINLLTESLEHSVPSTFADPSVLDFETYSRQEVLPGAVYPIKQGSVSNVRRLEDYFFTLKTSTLPAEGVNFGAIVESKSQFVVGDFPSIHGGAQTEGSKTLGEYQESRSYALQRLSIPYQLLYYWWADVIHKAVIDHIKNMLDDESYTVQAENGRFANINFFKQDFDSGKFDLLIPESSIQLPMSFDQKRLMLQNIVQLNNEFLNQFLFAPENRHTVLRFLGIDELNSYDANQTIKQLREIDELLAGRESPIEPEADDDEIHLRVVRTFIASDLGQDYKRLKPDSYMMILVHAREHMMSLSARLAEQQGQQGQQKSQEQQQLEREMETQDA